MNAKKMLALFLLIMLSCNSANAKMLNLNWHRQNTILLLPILFFSGIDALQTMSIRRNKDFEEANPVLGRYPKKRKVLKMFAIEICLGALLTAVLQKKASILYQSAVATIEAATTANNFLIGIKIKF